MQVRAPGRMCLFGEHQDYLFYPIIAAAIDRHIFIEANPINQPLFKIDMPDIKKSLELPIFSETDLSYESKRDYLRSSYNLFRRLQFNWTARLSQDQPDQKGYNIKITGNIPINAGASSSSALTIAWLKTLSLLANKSLSPEEIAKFGYEAEVGEFKEAGGMMDHFTSALGGIIYMETAPVFKPSKFTNCIKNFEKSFVLINSEQKKDTVGDLRKVKTRALESFEKIKQMYPSFDRYTTKLSQIEPYLDKLEPELRRTLIGNLNNRDLTQTALKIFEKAEKTALPDSDKQMLGKLIHEHHVNLSQNVGISTEKVDSIVDFCMKNGAYGAKINGSGFGGTLFAYCPNNRDSLVQALKEKGIKYYPVEISQGAGEY